MTAYTPVVASGVPYAVPGPTDYPFGTLTYLSSQSLTPAQQAVAQGNLGLPASYDYVAVPATAAAALSANTLITLSGAASSPSASTADNTVATLGGKADGFVTAAAASGAACIVQRSGPISGFSGLTPGATYWLGTAGGVASSPPTASGTTRQVVGVAVNAGTLDFRPGQLEYNE